MTFYTYEQSSHFVYFKGGTIVVEKEAKDASSCSVPAAVGPYSQAVRFGNLLFTSGQLPVDPRTGLIPDRDISSHTRRAMENLSAVLKANGTGLEHVVKITIFLTDLSGFPQMNETYTTFFQGSYPARSCVQVAALPKGAAIELEAIAYVPELNV